MDRDRIMKSILFNLKDFSQDELEAYDRMLKYRADIEILISGKQYDRFILEELIKKFNLEKRYDFAAIAAFKLVWDEKNATEYKSSN